MADDKKTTAMPIQGTGPLGQSGVNPSGTIQRSYQREFVEKHRPPSEPQNSPAEKAPTDRR